MHINEPVIKATTKLPEMTIKAIILGLVLAAILAASNTFLALKIGVLTASSIPAAILSMGVLRFFKRNNILENNLVQTAASAGEAIAGGVVYTAPALIIIHAWLHFGYLATFMIAIIGGMLGVLFTIPIRRIFIKDPSLKFPEAQAITKVLVMGSQKAMGISRMLIAATVGGMMEIGQNATKLIANNLNLWVTKGTTTFGFGTGFSATLLGAGYLMGFDVGVSVLLGALIASGALIPIFSHFSHTTAHLSAAATAASISNNQLRYVGIGAMLVAGLMTLLQMIKPLITAVKNSSTSLYQATTSAIPRTDYDMPMKYIIGGTLLLLLICALLFQQQFHHLLATASETQIITLIIAGLALILILGFIASAICGYFSGLVGVAASPGSAVAIASVMIVGILIFALFQGHHTNPNIMRSAAAITIMIASIIMGAACVANNNSQDLKVGSMVGATPYKQQLMLLLGALMASIVTPIVMQLLYQAYGIAGVMPHAGMDPSNSLPAPPAAAMAAIAQGVFQQGLPVKLMAIGGGITLTLYILQRLTQHKLPIKLSMIGIAIGMYLPLTSSMPLFLGALMQYIAKKRQKTLSDDQRQQSQYQGITTACGLVAGAAITNVILAIPLALMHGDQLFSSLPAISHSASEVVGIICTLALCAVLARRR